MFLCEMCKGQARLGSTSPSTSPLTLTFDKALLGVVALSGGAFMTLLVV